MHYIKLLYVLHQTALCTTSNCSMYYIKLLYVLHQTALCTTSNCSMHYTKLLYVLHQTALTLKLDSPKFPSSHPFFYIFVQTNIMVHYWWRNEAYTIEQSLGGNTSHALCLSVLVCGML